MNNNGLTRIANNEAAVREHLSGLGIQSIADVVELPFDFALRINDRHFAGATIRRQNFVPRLGRTGNQAEREKCRDEKDSTHNDSG